MDVHPRGVALPRPGSALVTALLVSACASAVFAERLSIRTFSVADGLGSSFVGDVMQDAAGYVWFATRDGLSRWNGYEFTTLGQDSGLAVLAIDRIRQVRSGAYYVICNDGSLYSYRPGDGAAHRGRIVFRRHRVQYEGRDVAFSRLFEDSRGTLWGGGQGVVVRDLGGADEPIGLDRLSPSSGAALGVTAIVEGRDGSLWIATGAGLVRRLPDGTLARYSLSPPGDDDPLHALALDRAGRLWVAHARLGAIVLDPRALPRPAAWQMLALAAVPRDRVRLPDASVGVVVLTRANGLPDNNVTSLLAASNGDVWVGTGAGLARFDGTAFTRYTRDNGLCDNVIHALWEDGDRHLWVATPGGAMRIVLEGFSRYTTTEGLAANWIVSIGEAADGTVQAIGVDWSVSTFDGRRFHASRLPVPPGSTAMWASQAAFRDRRGRWWALTNQGLYRFENETPGGPAAIAGPGRRYTARDGLPSLHIFRAYEDRSGALWVGTRATDPRDGGLARVDPRLQRAVSFGPAHGVPEGHAPSAFAEDRDGSLWVGFYEGGLARYRDGRFRLYTTRDGVLPGMVTALLVDRRGRLWMTTNLAGVGRIDDPSADPPRVTAYSTREGLTSNNARALAEDALGRIYVGSVRGIDRLDPATGRVRSYGPEDGLLSDFVTAARCDSHGDLWFGTYGGLFRLKPDRERQEDAPPIAITGVRIAGEMLPVEELGQSSVDHLVLDPDQRDVAIDFLSVSRHRAHGISYQFSIDPPGGGWSARASARSVNFARLSPGRYRFAVRAVTPDGKVSVAPATVAFTIRPPIWQRWWVIALGALALGAAAAGAYRYRVRRLLEIERLRMAIASDLHDEVATNLGSIAMFSTLVRQEIAGPSPFLERITVLATESVDAIREIIWSIDPKPETIASLLVRLRDAMVTTCRANGMHLAVSVPPDGLDQNLTPEQRKNLWLMLKEAIANAARHSGGTDVTVTATRAGRQVRITVCDNGTTPTASADSSGRGLATMRSRAEALDGTATVRTAPGGGTMVEFLVRLEI